MSPCADYKDGGHDQVIHRLDETNTDKETQGSKEVPGSSKRGPGPHQSRDSTETWQENSYPHCLVEQNTNTKTHIHH